MIFAQSHRPIKDLPRITSGVLDSLENEQLISSQKVVEPAQRRSKKGESFRYGNPRYESRRIITVRGKIYEAVDSDFVGVKEKSLAESVFINYRRADSEAYAGRVYQSLEAEYGKDAIYMDVDNIRKGTNFEEELNAAIDSCKAIVCVIGPIWLQVKDKAGKRRLDNPEDLVRKEIKRALDRKIRIFPVLVGGAEMPTRDALPPDIQDLAKQNAISLRHESWGSDVFHLTKELDSLILKSTTENQAIRLGLLDRGDISFREELHFVETGGKCPQF